MSLYHNNEKIPISEVGKYNTKNRIPGSCITFKACIHCGLVVHDTLCLCVGNFMCPGCGGRNGMGGWPVENFKFPDNYQVTISQGKYSVDVESIIYEITKDDYVI